MSRNRTTRVRVPARPAGSSRKVPSAPPYTPPKIDFADPTIRRLALVALCAAVAKMVLALTTSGTNDVWSFWQWGQKIREIGVIGTYHADPLFIHPPFAVTLIRIWSFLQNQTGLKFAFWLRFSGIVADTGSLYLVYQISRRFLGDRLPLASLALMALAPASLFISGFHGNTDPIVVFCVVLAVYYASVKEQYWLAGAALGMGCSCKMWPVFLFPVLFFYLPAWRARFLLFGTAAAVMLLAACPYILQDPAILATRILGYNSAPGFWGVTRVITFRPAWLLPLMAYIKNGKYFTLFWITLLAFFMNRGVKRAPLFAQCGMATFVFMALTPGFGVQYISWLIPWLAWASVWYVTAFHLASGTFLFLVYTYWSKGLPWDFANAGVGPWPKNAIVFELITWGLVVIYLLLNLSSVLASNPAVSVAEREHAAPGVDAQEAKPRRWIGLPSPVIRWLVIPACCAAVFKAFIALSTGGSSEIRLLGQFFLKYNGAGAWAAANPPPFVLYVLSLCNTLQQSSGLRFAFWFRFLGTIADAGSLYLVYRISRRFFGGQLRLAPLAMVAVAPVSLMITGFHGSTYPIMLFFVLLAVYYLSAGERAWLAGAAYGMSCNMGGAAFILSPVLFLYLRSWSSRVQFFGAASVAVVLGCFPYILQDPGTALSSLTGFQGKAGVWGIPRVFPSVVPWYSGIGWYLAVISIAVMAFLLNWRRTKLPLFAQCGLAMFLFLALTPGFGLECLIWLVPWLAWSGLWYTAALQLTAGTFLFMVYTFWSKGFPWDFADAGVGPWPSPAIVFELLTWGLVVLYVPLMLRGVWRARREQNSPQVSQEPSGHTQGPAGDHAQAAG